MPKRVTLAALTLVLLAGCSSSPPPVADPPTTPYPGPAVPSERQPQLLDAANEARELAESVEGYGNMSVDVYTNQLMLYWKTGFITDSLRTEVARIAAKHRITATIKESPFNQGELRAAALIAIKEPGVTGVGIASDASGLAVTFHPSLEGTDLPEVLGGIPVVERTFGEAVALAG